MEVCREVSIATQDPPRHTPFKGDQSVLSLTAHVDTCRSWNFDPIDRNNQKKEGECDQKKAAWQPMTSRDKMRRVKADCHTWELEVGNTGRKMEAKESQSGEVRRSEPVQASG